MKVISKISILGILFLLSHVVLAENLPKSLSANNKKVQEMERYKITVLNKQNQLVLSKLSNVESTITLSIPLKVELVQDFSTKYKVSVKSVSLYLIEKNGEIAVGLGSLGLTQNILPSLRTDSKSIIGVYVIEGIVPIQVLSRLQNDKRVFLVDIFADKRISNSGGRNFGAEMLNRSVVKQ